MKNFKSSFLFVALFSFPLFVLAHNEKEHTSGNTDALRGSPIRSEVYSRHISGYSQPGIDLTEHGYEKGRIAIGSDGNVFASDDLGAIPFGIGILAKSGLLNQIVHLGFNNNPNPDRHSNEAKDQPGLFQNIEYANLISKTAEVFELDSNYIFDYTLPDQKEAGIRNLVKEINRSSEDDPLYIIQAGVMIHLYEVFSVSEPTKLQYVTVITHSGWNDIECYDSHKNENIIDILRDFPAVKFDYIRDQNAGLRSRTGWAEIDWMQSHSDTTLNWLYTCAQKGDPYRWGFFNLSSEVDISDAGMFYYLITGDENASFDKLKTVLLKQVSLSGQKREMETDVHVYPNPFCESLHISMASTVLATRYSIYGMCGNLLVSNALNNEKHIVLNNTDLTLIHDGIIMLVLETDKGKISIPILKVKK